MKEMEAHDEGLPGAPSGQPSQARADPQVVDQTAQEPAQSQATGVTMRGKAQPEVIAEAAVAPTPPQAPGQTTTSRESAGPESLFVLVTPEEESEEQMPSIPQPPVAPSPERAQVHVAPNLLDLTTGRVDTAAEEKRASVQRDLDQVVRVILIVGLAVSTLLMLSGIVLEITRRQDLPTVEPDFGEVFSRVLAFRPSGFLALGLLMLLATPMLRVLGSIFAFVYERDWRFAGITFVVLMIVISSILLGKG